MWFALLVGCPAPLEAVDHCEANGVCTPCDGDAACVVAANPCGEVALCGHVDDDIAVIALGCSEALERPLPPEACVCDEVCGFFE